jgi:iron complex outermembrane receptor protein
MMKRRKSVLAMFGILFVLLILLESVTAATLTGTIRDGKRRTPLEGAEVRLGTEGQRAFTSQDGRYRFEQVRPGRYTIRVTCFGYAPGAVDVTVDPDPSGVVTADLNLSPVSLAFGEITVVGEAPPPLTSVEVDAAQIRQIGPSDIGEVLRRVPELNAIRRGGYGLDPSLRGLSGPRVAVIIDGGVHVNGGCPSRMDPPTSHVNPVSLETVEIVKGPETVRYGPAFSGLLNLVTGRPEARETFGVTASAGFGYETNTDGKRGDVSVSGGDRRVDFIARGSALRYDNYTDGRGEEVPSSYRVNAFSGRLALNVSDRQRLQLSLTRQSVLDALFAALPMDNDEDNTWIGALDYSMRRSVGRLKKLDAQVYATSVDHWMTNRRKPAAATVRAAADLDSRTRGFRVESFFSLPRTRGLQVGLDEYYLRLDGIRTRDILAGPMAGMHFNDIVWPDAVRNAFGLFGELHLKGVLNGEATLGLRLDRTAMDARKPDPAFAALSAGPLERTDYTTSTFGSLSMIPHQGWEIDLSAARGVRAPSILERYVFLLPVGLDRYDYVGDPGLEPETNTEVNAGVIRTGKGYSLGVNLFSSWMRNFVSAVVDPEIARRSPDVLGVKRFANLERASRIGVEINGRTRLGGGFSLSGAGTWMRGTNEVTDDPLPEIPPVQVDVSLEYMPENRSFRGGVYSRFVRGQDRVSSAFAENTTPGFVVVDLRGGFSMGRGRYVNLSLENAFNETYYDHLNRMSRVDGSPIYEPGRNFHVMFGVSF